MRFLVIRTTFPNSVWSFRVVSLAQSTHPTLEGRNTTSDGQSADNATNATYNKSNTDSHKISYDATTNDRFFSMMSVYVKEDHNDKKYTNSP